DSAMRQRIEADFEKSEKELREKLQQATWLADSVLEATQNQLRDESSKGKRESSSLNELLDALENRAAALMFSYGVDVARLAEPEAPTDPPSDADAEGKHQHDHAEALLGQLESLSAPRLLTGARPYIVSILVLVGAIVAGQFLHGSLPTLAQ